MAKPPPKRVSRPTTIREAEKLFKQAGFKRVDFGHTGKDNRLVVWKNPDTGVECPLPHGSGGATISPRVGISVLKHLGLR